MPGPTRRARRAITQNAVVGIVLTVLVLATLIVPSYNRIITSWQNNDALGAIHQYGEVALAVARAEANQPVLPSNANYTAALKAMPRGMAWTVTISTIDIPVVSSSYGNFSVDVADYYSLTPYADGIAMQTPDGSCVMALVSLKKVTTWIYNYGIGTACNGGQALQGPKQRRPFPAAFLTTLAPTSQGVSEIGTTYNAGNDATVTAVSCPTATGCALSGYYRDANDHYQAFIVEKIKSRWGTVQNVANGLYPPTSNDSSFLNYVSCPTVGNCTAGGEVVDASTLQSQAFVVDEVAGYWQPPQEVVTNLNAGGNARVNYVSCFTQGNCAIGGSYLDAAHHQQAFVANEVGGVWYAALPLALTLNQGGNAQVVSVACDANSTCTATGQYEDAQGHYQAFIANEVNGSWLPAAPVAQELNAGGNALAYDVSCLNGGNCAAVGTYTDAQGHRQAFVDSEVNSVWSPAQEVAGGLNTRGNAFLDGVSCLTIGNCSADGQYQNGLGTQAFAVDERSGVWKAPQTLASNLSTQGLAYANALSCTSVGNCSAVGGFRGAGGIQAFVDNQVDGVWQPAIEVAGRYNAGGASYLGAISCASAGNCVAGGRVASPNGFEAFFDPSFSGNWGS